MINRFLSVLCLFVLGASLCSPALAQTSSSKKRPAGTASLPGLPGEQKFDMADAGAFSDGANGVVVKWTTALELGIAGFNIYRADGGNKQMVNPSLIAGSMTRHSAQFPENSGWSYSFYDRAGNADSKYFIEGLGIRSTRLSYGPVSPLRLKNLSSKLGYDPQQPSQNNGLIVRNEPTVSMADGKSRVRSGSAGPSSESDPIKQHFVAAQPGVKFLVKQDGIYHVTRAQLQAAGFNVAASAGTWQLYTDGVEQKIIVEPNGNYIEFYGKGVDTTYTDSRRYYLIAGPDFGQRMDTIYRRPFGRGITGATFRNTATFEERTAYIANFVNGDEDNWWGSAVSPVQPVVKHIALTDLDTQSPQKVNVEVSIHGYVNANHQLQVSLNGVVLGVIQYDGLIPISQTFTINAFQLLNGDNNLQFESLGGPSDYSILQHVKVDYPRMYRAQQNTLTFDTIGEHTTKVTGFNTANIRVFDLQFSEPQFISNTTVTPGANGFDVTIPSARGHRMIAVNENSLLTPASIVANTPSTLSSTVSTADMIIITHGNFTAAANTWATYRRNQGLGVDVVNIEDVFDEFDFGQPTPASIRNFLQYSKSADANLKYVMLVGDATNDQRNYLGQGFNDFIPTKFVSTGYGESPSDAWLGDFNGDSIPDLAIGRLPVRTSAPISLILSKVQAFEATVSTSLVNRGVLFVADDPNGFDFAAVNRQLAAQLPGNVPVQFIDAEGVDGPVVRQQIIDGINVGRFIVNYTGHGSTGVWSTRQIFRYLDIPSLTNSGDKLSLFFMLTCLNGFFVDPVNEGVGEQMIDSPNGGAPTTWTSTGETTPDIQAGMATHFFQILGAGTYSRLGDATEASLQNAPNTDVPLTWVILGDPAIKIK